MFRTLHGRLLLVLLALLLPLGVGFVFVTQQTAQRYYQEITQQLNRALATNLLADRPDLMIGAVVDTEKFDGLARDLAMTNPGVEIYILDAAGKIIGSSVAMADLERKTVATGPLEAFKEGRTFPLLGTDPRRAAGGKIFSVAPLDGGNGYLYVLLADRSSDSVIRATQNSTVLRLGLWGGALTLLLVFGLGVLAFALLTRRLRRLQGAMNRFRSHDFVLDTPLAVPAHARDEIDNLQTVFAEMSARISEQVQSLRQVDTLRRELITNVSHDLRTPLAALQGYLETLQLKEGLLSESERQTYLAAARKHAERLGRLIGDLFELSRLDADAVEAQLEAFPLQDLAQDVVLKFSGLARERGVVLNLEVPSDLPFVRGDLGLLERALTNLIDNALRYTPSGGEVRLALCRQGQGVGVSVSDTGHGIPEDELPHIFERFFRASANRDASGTGLGLAIAKRILALHGSAIEVKSRVGAGTTFHFDLSLA